MQRCAVCTLCQAIVYKQYMADKPDKDSTVLYTVPLNLLGFYAKMQIIFGTECRMNKLKSFAEG